MEKLSQKQKLYNLLSDNKPHSTVEIMEKVYGGSHLGLARVGARIWDLKADGHEITGWTDKENKTIYWYQLKVKDIPKPIITEKPRQPQMFKTYF